MSPTLGKHARGAGERYRRGQYGKMWAVRSHASPLEVDYGEARKRTHNLDIMSPMNYAKKNVSSVSSLNYLQTRAYLVVTGSVCR